MEKLKERMDAFSDAVIAIIVTIMVLELPIPKHDLFSEYMQFGKAVGIFFISFCFVANIWYQHSMLFNDAKTMNDHIFIREFIFLAFLSLMPIFTKIITYDTNRTTVLAYGILNIIVNGLFVRLSYAVIKQKYTDQQDIKRIFHKVYGNHNNFLGYASITILVLAYFFPKAMVVVYLAMPVISFVTTRHDYTDLQDVAQLPKNEKEQFLETSGSSLRELRLMQREIMRKYRGKGRNNPEMQAELTALFQSHPELKNKRGRRF